MIAEAATQRYSEVASSGGVQRVVQPVAVPPAALHHPYEAPHAL